MEHFHLCQFLLLQPLSTIPLVAEDGEFPSLLSVGSAPSFDGYLFPPRGNNKRRWGTGREQPSPQKGGIIVTPVNSCKVSETDIWKLGRNSNNCHSKKENY